MKVFRSEEVGGGEVASLKKRSERPELVRMGVSSAVAAPSASLCIIHASTERSTEGVRDTLVRLLTRGRRAA